MGEEPGGIPRPYSLQGDPQCDEGQGHARLVYRIWETACFSGAASKFTGVAGMANEELVARIQAGIGVAENMLQLWGQVKAFIHTVALRYQGYADLDGLEQEGYLALYDAVDGFQEEKGCKFITYAGHWMRKRMRRYIGSCCQPVKIPPRERCPVTCPP